MAAAAAGSPSAVSSDGSTSPRKALEEETASTADATHYGKKARQGLKLMLGRQVFIQVFTFVGGIILARTLTPEIFGIFGISMFLVNTLALFGDFGLAPSLVQRKDEFSERDLQVAFTLQQGLLTAVAAAIWLAAPYFLQIYPEIGGQEMVWLIRVMAFILFLQSWRSMSVLQMERHLDFKQVAWIEVVEALSFQGLAVALALLGFGVWSLVWATLARGVLGTTLAFAASPWRVRLAWDVPKAREILRFGLPFQAGRILNSAGDWVTPLLVGTLVGPAGVGFLTWAGSNARKPLLLLSNFVRVSFPHFARLQDDPKSLLRIYERYLLPSLIFGGLWLAMIIAAAEHLVPVIYTDKWSPAIPALYIYGSLLLLQTVARVTGTLLRSTGKVNFTTAITGVTTVLQILVAVPLIPWIGFLAVPVGMLVAFTFKTTAFLMVAPIGSRSVALASSVRVLAPTVIAAIAGTLAATGFESVLSRVAASLLVTASVYAAVSYRTIPPWVRELIGGTCQRVLDYGRHSLARPLRAGS